MIKTNYPSEESLTLALELLNSVCNDDFSEPPAHSFGQSYFLTGNIYDLTGNIYDFFNELKAYLVGLSSSKEKIVALEAFEILSGMAYDKLKIDLALVN